MSKSKQIPVCGNCGSSDVKWHCSQINRSGVADGRLRLHDVDTRFYLGCNECSETLAFLSGDAIADKINNL